MHAHLEYKISRFPAANWFFADIYLVLYFPCERGLGLAYIKADYTRTLSSIGQVC